MDEQLFLLLRISKRDYNKTLYDEYKLYMNPQIAFRKDGLMAGQQDKYEGAITNQPSKIFYSTDIKKSWNLLANPSLIYKNSSAYIYCMYGLKDKKEYYNVDNNTYRHVIPWKFIKPLWQGNETEMIIVANTSLFIEKFEKAAKNSNYSYAYGKVFYDLDEKMADIKYIYLAMKNPFESVFHKVKDCYEDQEEVRFALICPEKPNHIELNLAKDPKLMIFRIPLVYGESIGIEFSELVFDDKHGVPIRFSSNIRFYKL